MIRSFYFFTLIFALPTFASTTLNLDTKSSQLQFTTIKKLDIAEENTLQFKSGHIDEKGNAIIKIDTTTINSNIEIRDTRLKTLVFNTDNFPTINIEAQLDNELETLDIGSLKTINIPITISIQDKNKVVNATVTAFKTKDKVVVITTPKPIIITAKDFSLDEAIEQLKSIAQLDYISHVVPVSFTLLFSEELNK